MGTLYNPINSLMKAFSIAQMLKQAKYEQEAMERARLREEREANVQDIEMRMRLLAAGRPVRGGAVEDEVAPPDIGLGPDVVKDATFRFTRKADPSRTVKYKTSTGETLEAELYPPEEQARRAMEAKAAEERMLAAAKALAEVQKISALRDIGESPGAIASKRIEATSKEAEARRSEAAAREAERAKHQAELQRQRDEAAMARVRETNASRQKVAAAREGAVANREEQRETSRQSVRRLALYQKFKEQHDQANTEEQKRHARALEIGERLKLISEQLKDADDVERRTLNRERRSLEAELARTQKEAQVYFDEKQRALKRAKAVYAGEAPAEVDVNSLFAEYGL